MRTIDSTHTWVRRAAGVGPAFSASWDAYELIRLVAGSYAEHVSDWYLTWMAVIPPACEGRDALGFAPSIPQGPGLAFDSEELSGVPDEQAAQMLAVLASVCAEKLRAIRPYLVAGRDVSAVAHAIKAADEIYGLLSQDPR